MKLEDLDLSQYKSNIQRNKFALYSFYALLAITLLKFVIGILYYYEIKSYIDSDGEYFNQDIELVNQLSYIPYIIAHITVIITFLMWFHRSYKNLNDIGVKLNFSANMSIWGFMIPIINLSRPVKIAKEIDAEYDYLNRRLDENHQMGINNYSIIIAWFISYWVVNIFNRVVMKMKDETIEELLELQFYDGISEFGSMISIILTIIFIKTIGKSENKFEDLVSLEQLNELGETSA